MSRDGETNKDTQSRGRLSNRRRSGPAENVFRYPKLLCQNCFVEVFSFPPTTDVSTTHTHHNINKYPHEHTPSRLKGEPGGVPAVSAEGAEGPHDQLEASVVDVPQVDVFVGDLHGALPVDVQVRGRHEVHVETL